MKGHRKKSKNMSRRRLKVGKSFHEHKAKMKANKNQARNPLSPAVVTLDDTVLHTKALKKDKILKRNAELKKKLPFKDKKSSFTGTVEGQIGQSEMMSVDKVVGEAGRKLQKYEEKTGGLNGNIDKTDSRVEVAAKSSAKAYYREFKQVIEEADVILEVLDARDPLGFRSLEMERAVQEAGPSKRIILLLNKADLVPKENLEAWLKHLRTQLPTVVFKSSVSRKKVVVRYRRGNKKKLKILKTSTEMLQSSPSIGMQTLMSLLNNYCRNKGIKGSICVGVVGYPNVGKSSVINSLKRDRACDVGAQAGVTKLVQTIQLTKNIKLLDSPGLILTQEGGTEAALKNAVNIQQLGDPISLVEAILLRIPKETMASQYGLEDFSDPHNFLCRLAQKTGVIKKGGRPNTEEAARKVVHDWQSGKIRYYTEPPAPTHTSDLGASIVTEFAKEFDLNSIEIMEMNDMQTMQEQQQKEKEPSMETDENAKVFRVESESRKKKKKKKVEDKLDPALLLAGNQRLRQRIKRALKLEKKKKRRQEKAVNKLADNLEKTLRTLE